MMAAGYQCAVCDRVSPLASSSKVIRKVVPTAFDWKRIAGDAISADLSRAGPYVISHRASEHTVSYRPPGKHHPLGVFATEDEAKQAAQRHTSPPPPGRRSLIADVQRELRERGIPCVAISDAKKALFSHAQLKAFHFVVYDKDGDNWLLWCGEPTAAVRSLMAEWARVFGNGFQVAYAVRRAGGIVYKNSSGTRLTLNGGSAREPTP
jgi:hypothetical protein